MKIGFGLSNKTYYFIKFDKTCKRKPKIIKNETTIQDQRRYFVCSFTDNFFIKNITIIGIEPNNTPKNTKPLKIFSWPNTESGSWYTE